MRTQPEYIIGQLEIHPSRLNKEGILESAMEEGLDEFFEGVRMCLDNLYTFGVKQVPESTVDGQGLSWVNFKELAEALYRRELTGHAARDAIELAMGIATQRQWNQFYRRILIKDMRAGFSEKTVNKVAKKFPQYRVPVFECQLAHDAANHDSKLTGTKLVEKKLDGCLSEDWTIEFDDGKKVTIKEVVDSKIKGKVKSYNTITGKIEFNEITGWAVDGKDDTINEYEWFIITLENGIKLPPLTGNHLIYLPKLQCYRRADLLEDGDTVLVDI